MLCLTLRMTDPGPHLWDVISLPMKTFCSVPLQFANMVFLRVLVLSEIPKYILLFHLWFWRGQRPGGRLGEKGFKCIGKASTGAPLGPVPARRSQRPYLGEKKTMSSGPVLGFTPVSSHGAGTGFPPTSGAQHRVPGGPRACSRAQRSGRRGGRCGARRLP